MDINQFKQDIASYIKSKLGLFGALAFKKEVENCPCKPCQTIRDMLSGVQENGQDTSQS